MTEIERDLFKEVVALRGHIDSALVSSAVSRDRNAADLPYNALQSFTELALPYVHKKTKIEESVGIVDRDYWVKFQAERNKAKKEEAEKKKKEAK